MTQRAKPPTDAQINDPLLGLVDRIELDGVGHGVQPEASVRVSKQILRFTRIVEPV